MAYFLYNIIIHISIIILLPYFFIKMLTARKYRDGIPERFGFVDKDKFKNLKGGKAVWVHAVSVGETKAVLPVLRLLKRRRPDVRVVFSTVTATGNRTASQEGKGLIDTLIYFPLDLPWAVRRVSRMVKPVMFIVVEKEIWPNAFRTMYDMGAPVVIVNGTMSGRSAKRYARFSFLFKDVFSRVSLFLARTDADLEKAVLAGVTRERALVSGNIKFDLSPSLMDSQFVSKLKEMTGVGPGTKVITAGSTHPGEEEMLLEAFRSLAAEFDGLKLIIAPRHPERFTEVEGLIKKSGLNFSRRSKGGSADVVLLDSIGELMTVYSFSDIAVVGGSLVPGIGGHNLLEPAYFGKPVVYGSHLTTYLGMAELLENKGGGIRAADEKELTEALRSLLSNELLLKRTGANAKKVVEENRGASERTAASIEKLLRS
ncbi:MAG: 3-deoxy-D-manno-octulosonic acid transferase [Deltaproteobacteria bacterium]|nr:3-deoxy-D-manno-octulosonic acid transferase [Deltaproteobacteria bacterium]